MREPSRSTATAEELVLFEQSGERYALRSSVVREVLRAFSFVPLPKAPPIVEGLINLRGEILPLLNTRRRFGLSDRPLSLSDHFIIAWQGSRWIALRVDRVLNLERLPIYKASEQGKYIAGNELVAGVAQTPDGMILIQDLARFLSAAETEALSAALSEMEKQR